MKYLLFVSILRVEIDDGIGYSLLLIGGEFGVHRQRKHLAAQLFGDGERGGCTTDRQECLLMMQRKRIVDHRGDLVVGQILAQSVALPVGDLYGVLMVDVATTRMFDWENEWCGS